MQYNAETYAKKMKIPYLDRLIDSVVVKKRQQMWNMVTTRSSKHTHIDLYKIGNCLDVGTTSDSHYESSNFFLKLIPKNVEITSLSDQAIHLNRRDGEQLLARYIKGDIVQVKDFSETFNLVICSATLEHVGALSNQVSALENLIKLSESQIFITVPNRWHPIEFHSRVPLLHWLPNKIWRKIFAFIPAISSLSLEDNLNFISMRQMKRELKKNKRVNEVCIRKVKLLGFTSNFAIIVNLTEE